MSQMLSKSCIKFIPKLSQCFPKVVSKLFKICSKVVPKLSQSSFKVVPQICPSYDFLEFDVVFLVHFYYLAKLAVACCLNLPSIR